MKITHIALWVNDLEKMRDFYCYFFGAIAGKNYLNTDKHFESCFLKLGSGISVELMQKTDQILSSASKEIMTGFHHMAFSTGSKKSVDQLTLLLEAKGYKIKSQPHVTGDGFYESVVSDPEGNTIEITV